MSKVDHVAILAWSADHVHKERIVPACFTFDSTIRWNSVPIRSSETVNLWSRSRNEAVVVIEGDVNLAMPFECCLQTPSRVANTAEQRSCSPRGDHCLELRPGGNVDLLDRNTLALGAYQ